jgi:hypothetical protein
MANATNAQGATEMVGAAPTETEAECKARLEREEKARHEAAAEEARKWYRAG